MAKRCRRRNPAPAAPGVGASVFGLDLAVWEVRFAYSKGILSGSRHTRVSVTHRPTGRTREMSFYATGRAAARREAAAQVQKLVAAPGGRF